MARRVLLPGLCLLVLLTAPAPTLARGGGDDDVRVPGRCSGAATARLELRRDDDGLRLEFEARGLRTGTWRITIVHERRVDWRGSRRVTRSGGRVRVRRVLEDLGGPDRVAVRAAGPRGATCEAAATLAG